MVRQPDTLGTSLMNKKPNGKNTNTSKPDQPRSLQQLAIALTGLIFILLFLFMGIMNLNALDRALVGFMETKGLNIIKEVRQSAETYFHQSEQSNLNSDSENGLSENSVSFQESFLIGLMELAREIDFRHGKNRLSNEQQIVSLTNEEHLSLIAFMDEKGRVILKNRSVPAEILRLADPVIRGYEPFQFRLFNRSEHTEGMGFIALRRNSEKGTVILGLNDRDVIYRWARFSIQKAVETTDRASDTAYLTMTDSASGRIVAQSGELPDDFKEQPETAMLSENAVTSRRIISGEQNILEIVAPVRILGEFIGIMRVGIGSDTADRILKKNRHIIFVSIVFMIIITVLSLWFLYKNQNSYLNRMQAMERHIQQAKRLSALGRLAAGVAHEIRNPLNAISMGMQRLERRMPDQSLTRVIRDEIRRLNQIIEEFLSISRTRKLEFKAHELTAFLRQTLLLIAEEAESEGVRIIIQETDTPFIVSMDPDKMKQAFLNIIKNAVESIPGQGSITLAVTPERGEWVSIGISDTGVGLSEEEISHVFDLFHTTKEKGLGFGLPLAHEIIQGHGGRIRVVSQSGVGTTFEILLPLAKQIHT